MLLVGFCGPGKQASAFHVDGRSNTAGATGSSRPMLGGDGDGEGEAIADLQRRLVLEGVATASVTFSGNQEFSNDPKKEDAGSVVVPLEYNERLQAYLVCYTIGGVEHRAVLDSGSPFLTVPRSCDADKVFGNRRDIWGCSYRPEDSLPTVLEDTIEVFDQNRGRVRWRLGRFAFRTAANRDPAANNAMSGLGKNGDSFVFGVLDSGLVRGLGGGVFLGLADSDYYRPSFLGQTNIRAFRIDLRSETKTLTLINQKLLASPEDLDCIPLVDDLCNRYKLFLTKHYTAKALSVTANGFPLTKSRKPVYAIFDTGVSGMLLSPELYEERYTAERERREKSLWGSVEIRLRTNDQRGTASLTAAKPITVPMAKVSYPAFKAHLVVLGLAFLEHRILTVDIEDRKLRIV